MGVPLGGESRGEIASVGLFNKEYQWYVWYVARDECVPNSVDSPSRWGFWVRLRVAISAIGAMGLLVGSLALVQIDQVPTATAIVLSCADGGVCVVGDVGPGGGVVFYVEASGSFVCGAAGELVCRYLEAAPSGWFGSVGDDPVRSWAHVEFRGVGNGAGALGRVIGSGFANSVAIVAQGNVNPELSAARLARGFGGGGFADWYLPSLDELNQLWIRRVLVDANRDATIYWSSSELHSRHEWVWHQWFHTGVTNRRSAPGKDMLYRVRPIRAFGVVAASDTTTTTTTTTTVPETTTTTTTTTTVPPAIAVVRALPEVRPLTPASQGATQRAVVSASGDGFAPFEYVQLVVASTPRVINSGYADAEGAITLSGALPADLAAGNHSLALYAPSSGRGFRKTLIVSPALADARTLPATGSDQRIAVLLGMASLLLGLRLVRRPRNSSLAPEE